MAGPILPILSGPARPFAFNASASYLFSGFVWLCIRSAMRWTVDPEVGDFVFLTHLVSVVPFFACSVLGSWILFKLLGPAAGFSSPLRGWAAGTAAALLLWNERSWKIASLGYSLRGSYQMPLGMILGFHLIFVSHLLAWGLPPWRKRAVS
jgi:hypothetical protein